MPAPTSSTTSSISGPTSRSSSTTRTNGDQFQQSDRRKAYGLDLAQDWTGRWGDAVYVNAIGLQGRYDDIPKVGLYLTRARERLTTIREDSVNEWNVGIYAQNDTRWNEWLRTVLGLRWNQFDFDVRSDLPDNSGKASANVLSPKVQVVLGPWARTEYYLSYGQGFHSNDARGVTTRTNPDPRDPGYLQAVDPVTPLAKTTGYEVGLRSLPFEGFQTTLALWNLDVGSELLFVGDAGTTEPSRPSKRYGIEWYGYYTPRPWLAFDLLAAYTKARFTDDDPVGNHIPGRDPDRARWRSHAVPAGRLVRKPAVPVFRRTAARRGQLRTVGVVRRCGTCARATSSGSARRLRSRSSTCSTRR